MNGMLRVLRLGERLLMTLFWVLLLLGFNAPPLALMTVLCAAMHEGGHWLALRSVGARTHRPMHRFNGFLLPVRGTLSYKAELIVAAAGPLTNLVFGGICLALRPLGHDFFMTLASVSCLTGLCNLVPVGENDGERILYAVIAHLCDPSRAASVCHALSFILCSVTSFLALYLIWHADAAYWLFGVFLASLLSHMRVTLRDSERQHQISRKNEKTREIERKQEKKCIFSKANRG